jgi:hypothetical protein
MAFAWARTTVVSHDCLMKSQYSGVREYQDCKESLAIKRLCATTTSWRHSMTGSMLLGVAAILLTAMLVAFDPRAGFGRDRRCAFNAETS